MIQRAQKNSRVRVEFLFDDVQVIKEGLVLQHDPNRDQYLVQTDWGVEWFKGYELALPGGKD
jgi:hypothetical protein